MGSQRVRYTEQLTLSFTFIHKTAQLCGYTPAVAFSPVLRSLFSVDGLQTFDLLLVYFSDDSLFHLALTLSSSILLLAVGLPR